MRWIGETMVLDMDFLPLLCESFSEISGKFELGTGDQGECMWW